MEFRRALLRVAGEIGQSDLEKLKFACSDQIPDAKRERIHTAIDFFIALEEKGLVSPDNLEYLARQLRHIGRPTLLSYFQQMGFRVPDGTTHRSSRQCEPTVEEHLNKFLLEISDKLTCSEVDRLAFAWCRGYLNKTPDHIHSAHQLFILMTQRLAITPENLDILYIELNEMGRQDLCRLIEDYYNRNGIKHGFYPYYPVPKAGTPTSCSSYISSSPTTNSEYPPEHLLPSSRPSDLSLTTTSTNVSSTPSSDNSADKVTPHQQHHHHQQQHQLPVSVHHSRPGIDPKFIRPEEGSSILWEDLNKKHQEYEELKKMLENEQRQRKIESQHNSSLVDQHQSQILMLEKALEAKNMEIRELYREFAEHNLVSGLQSVSLSNLPETEYYPMNCHPHGYCIIFNNYQFYQVEESHEQLLDRGGADIDQKTLSDTFKRLQYNVEVYENLPSHEIVDTMKEISCRDHSKFDSFVCCILTHGEEGKIFGSDSLPVNLQDLTGLVKGTFCTTLVDKPKLFFIQACRGEKEEKGVMIERDGNSSLPLEADYLFGYATPMGKAAYRSRRHGSWFISELCDVFTKNAHAMGLSNMMKKVNRSVSEAYTKEGYKQCTEVVDRLRREVKFLPSYPVSNIP